MAAGVDEWNEANDLGKRFLGLERPMRRRGGGYPGVRLGRGPHVSPSYFGLGHSWISEGRLEDTAESSLLSCPGMLSGGGGVGEGDAVVNLVN